MCPIHKGDDTLSEDLSKLTKISKIGAIFARILMAVTIICTIVATVLLVVIYLNPDIITDIVNAAGGKINNIPIEDIDIKAVASVFAVSVMVLGPLGFTVLYFVNQMFTNIYRNNTPFTEDNARCLEIIAVLLVIYTIITAIFDGVMQWVIDIPFYQSYGVGISPLLVAVLLYFLALVFRHGAALQKQSDETL